MDTDRLLGAERVSHAEQGPKRIRTFTEPLGDSVQPLRAGSRPSAVRAGAVRTGRSIYGRDWPEPERKVSDCRGRKRRHLFNVVVVTYSVM